MSGKNNEIFEQGLQKILDVSKEFSVDMTKDAILALSRLYTTLQPKKEFVPGTTYINYAGRIYDGDEVSELVNSALQFTLTAGKYADEFEKRFADFSQQKFCLLVNSGSSANLLAFAAMTSHTLDVKIEPGDEIITVAAGFPTTLNPIIQHGAMPVFVDIKLGTYNIDETQLEAAYSNKTKAVFLAHTLGNPFNLNAVVDFCRKHNLILIEDCCDAVGSSYGGKMVGTFGSITSTSFYPAHHLTTGEGGSVLTNDNTIYRAALSIRDWGRDCFCPGGVDNSCGQRFNKQYGDLPFGYDHKYVYSHIGYNLKMTDMQAAIGVRQLDKLPKFIEARRKNYRLLFDGLSKFNDKLILPVAEPNSDPSWFAFPITVKDGDSLALTTYLEEHKIATRKLFGGNLIKQPAYKNIKYRKIGELPNTDKVMTSTFFIGVYPGITDEMIEYIIKVFENFYAEKR